MTDNKEVLFSQFLGFLETIQSEPTSLEYLGEPPESANSFDPYQMVGEWIALRHEIKQQGKLLRSAQDALQQVFKTSSADKEELQLRLEENQKQLAKQFEQQQEKLLKDLLVIMDDLDRACAFWQEEIESLSSFSIIKSVPQKSWWENLRDVFFYKNTDLPKSTSLNEILSSNQQGVELIRRSLLDLLRQRRVVPIEAQGQPFDPKTMYAVGRKHCPDIIENTVVQEVVKGYLWGDRILRESQVIVGTGNSEQVTGDS